MIRWNDHFGLKRRDGGELPDHLSIMLEFLQFVTAQEHANAKDAAAVTSLHSAQVDFITPPRTAAGRGDHRQAGDG